MLKTLVGIQLRGSLGMLLRIGQGKKRRGWAGKLFIALAVVYVLASIGLSLGMFFQTVLEAFHAAQLDWLYFAIAGLSGFVLSFIGSINLAQSTLFNARDNDLLLSLPLKPGTILFSRTISLYLMALMFQSVVLLPALVIWWLQAPFSPGFLLVFSLCGLLLPLMTTALSVLLGWMLAAVSERIKRKNLIVILLSLGFLGLYLWGYGKLLDAMNDLLARGHQIADAVRSTLFPAYHFGQAIAHASPGSLLLFAACALLPFLALMSVLSRRYIRLLTTRRGAAKIQYRGGGMKAGSLMTGLVTKELRRFFSSPIYIMNSAFGLFMMIALPFLVLFDKGGTIQTLIEQLRLPDDLIGVAAVLALAFLSGTVFISAPSISLEGKSLWILQSLPVSTLQALMAKAACHVLISLPPILFSGIFLGILLKLNVFYLLMCVLLPLAVNVFTALLGLALNLRFPKLDWHSEAVPVKQSMSTFLTMTLGFLLVAGVGACYFLLLMGRMSAPVFLLISLAFFSLISLGIFLYLSKTAPTAWKDLSEA